MLGRGLGSVEQEVSDVDERRRRAAWQDEVPLAADLYDLDRLLDAAEVRAQQPPLTGLG